MRLLIKCICIVIGVLLFAPSANGQCPDDPDAMIVNTQEKYDYMKNNFPNCNSYEFHMVNGKFIGDPRPVGYLVSLFSVLAGILILLNLVIEKFNLE